MPDGSFVAVQAPELCGGYFGKGPGAKNWDMSPTPFVPLLVWSDRQRRPEKMEAYVASQAYGQPGSQLGPSSAVAEPATVVSDGVASAVRAMPNVVLQDSHLIATEDEVGLKSGERGFRAALGWPTTGKASDRSALECLQAFRRGQLVPRRQIQGTLELNQCTASLAAVTPFVWDGRRFNADLAQRGTLIFQRVDPAMNDAAFFEGQNQVWPNVPGTTDKYFATFVSAPARDPNSGV
jgi:hypothetical protein